MPCLCCRPANFYKLRMLLHGATEKVLVRFVSSSLDCLEGSNPDDTVLSQKPKEQNWPCFLGRRDDIAISQLSVTETLINQSTSYDKRELADGWILTGDQNGEGGKKQASKQKIYKIADKKKQTHKLSSQHVMKPCPFPPISY